MPAISEIEASIRALPPREFFRLLGWIAERHLGILASDEFESPELETQMLASLDSPRYAVGDALLADIRARAAQGEP
jgi:hypothetical protein